MRAVIAPHLGLGRSAQPPRHDAYAPDVPTSARGTTYSPASDAAIRLMASAARWLRNPRYLNSRLGISDIVRSSREHHLIPHRFPDETKYAQWGMARPRRIDPELVVKARAAVAQAADATSLRAAQAVLMPALAHTTLEQTAALLGVGEPACRDSSVASVKGFNWFVPPELGRARRALMTAEDEKTFLAPWPNKPRRWRVGGLTAARGAGRETGPEGRTLGAVSFVGATRVAESARTLGIPRAIQPHRRVGKKLPETLAPC